MDVIILCGGKGTRIHEETISKPKPMVEIGGKPILWHIMKIYSYYGFNRFILALGYKGEQIKQYFYNYKITGADFSIKMEHDHDIEYLKHSDEKHWEIVFVDTGEETLKGGRIKRVEKYIKELWDTYNSKDFILSDIYNKRIYRKNLTDMNANKLFNYTIQLMETENNMKVLSELIPKIKDYKSKLILYSYDSFLLDFNMEDGLDYIMKVKDILEQKGKFPLKVSWGLNYHEMKDITEKFV